MADSRKQIIRYTTIAWALAFTAGLLFIIPIIAYLFGNIKYIFTEYATFVGGTAGPLSALAGFLFVYIAFQGQQIQIEKQEQQFQHQSFDSTFFNLLNYHREFIQNHKIGDLPSFSFFITYIKPRLSTFDILPGGEPTTGQYTHQVTANIFKENINNDEKNSIRKGIISLQTILFHIESSKNISVTPYYNILLCQISTEEKFLYFYYFITFYEELQPREQTILYEFLDQLDASEVLANHLEWLKDDPYKNLSKSI